MTSLHIQCSSSETILLCRLDLKSPLFFLLLPIRAYFEFILRRDRGAMLKLRSWLKIKDCCAAEIQQDLSFSEGSIRAVVGILVAMLLRGILVLKIKRTSYSHSMSGGGGEDVL